MSGNTDCYQPAEQKYRLTRGLLEVCNEFNQPVGMITKNAGMLRDKDLLKEIYKKFDKAAKRNVIHKKTAARRKSRYARTLSALATSKQ